MTEERSVNQIADLRLELGRYGGERRFLVQNTSEVSAFSVRFAVEPEEGKNSPIIAGEHEKIFPITELLPGEHQTLTAVITTGTGIHFRGRVTWRNPDGSPGHKEVDLSA